MSNGGGSAWQQGGRLPRRLPGRLLRGAPLEGDWPGHAGLRGEGHRVAVRGDLASQARVRPLENWSRLLPFWLICPWSGPSWAHSVPPQPPCCEVGGSSAPAMEDVEERGVCKCRPGGCPGA